MILLYIIYILSVIFCLYQTINNYDTTKVKADEYIITSIFLTFMPILNTIALGFIIYHDYYKKNK